MANHTYFNENATIRFDGVVQVVFLYDFRWDVYEFHSYVLGSIYRRGGNNMSLII
jgi:hypothetical protein